ncbi:MAG: YoaK family protein [Caulobacterales bacterium]
MDTLDERARQFAVGLSCLAGFVDALGFLALGGFFVSFMSGNTTRLGVGLAGHWPEAALAGALMGIFTLGVAFGVVIGRRAQAKRAGAVLALVAIAVSLAAVLATAGVTLVAGLVLAFAMGAENAVFERDGRVRVGLTYMTGALVGLGQRLANLVMGQSTTGWGFQASLWLGMAVGATLGAAAFNWIGLAALWAAAVAAGFISVATWHKPLAWR